MAENTPLTPLTPKQLEVLAWLATWLTSAEIGSKMGVSLNTVKTHCYAIYRKLDVGDQGELLESYHPPPVETEVPWPANN